MSAAKKMKKVSQKTRKIRNEKEKRKTKPVVIDPQVAQTEQSGDASAGAAHLQGQTAGGDWVSIYDVW